MTSYPDQRRDDAPDGAASDTAPGRAAPDTAPGRAAADAAHRAPLVEAARRRWLSTGNRDRLITLASPIVLLVLWEVLVRMDAIDARFFPPPSKILRQLVTLTQSGELIANTWASLKRLFWGSLIGGIPALLLGIVMGLYRPIRAIVDPLVAATYPVPKSAILPLILLIFGLGEASKIAMVAIGVFYPVLINATTGVLQINRIYLDVGKNFQASRIDVLRTIALPGALPFIMTGVKLGVGMGLILIAIAEMIGAKSGLGYMIWNAWEILSVETMYVGLLVIAVLGFLFTVILNELERWIVPWNSEP
jgi:NitT/TauT family transport system permease protein